MHLPKVALAGYWKQAIFLPPPNHTLCKSLDRGSTSLALDGHKLVVLRPQRGCFLTSCFCLLHFPCCFCHCYSVLSHFASLLRLNPFTCIVPYEEECGLIGLAPLHLFLGPWAFQLSNVCCQFLLGWPVEPFFSFPFFLWAHSRPIPLFLEEGHPSMASSSIWPMGQHVPLPILHGYPSSLGFHSPLVPATTF